jgi:hypothetical protein
MLSLTVRDLQMDTMPDERSILAMVIETGVEPDFFYTVVATIDGAVSVYFSNGGGTIGLGEREPVRTAAAELLDLAEHFAPHARHIDDAVVPEPGEVLFHFVTTGGLRSYAAQEQELGEDRDAFSPIFYASHDLLSRIREHSDA